MTAKDWDDVADLCAQAQDLVEETNGPNGLNSIVAHQKATEWMGALAMKATKKAYEARVRTGEEE